jgi:hypothetical protein
MEKIGARPASICVGLGLALVEDDLDNGSGERNVLKQHAPVQVDMLSPRRWFHDRLMEKLIAAIEA